MEIAVVLCRKMRHLHSNKISKLATSPSWNGTPPVESVGSGSGTGRLGKRFGNSFTQFETEDLKVRAILNDGSSLGICR